MTDLVLRVTRKHLARIASIRALPGLDAALQGDTVWLRISREDDRILNLLVTIADGPVFRLTDDQRLIPVAGQVPVERLAQLHWMPLTDMLTVALPSAAVPHFRVERLGLKLVRSEHERPADLLLCRLQDLLLWAENAPQIRIQCCSAAVFSAEDSQRSATTDRQTLVKANPLPPLPGDRFWLAGNLAIPLGLTWSPALDVISVTTAILRRIRCSDDNDGPEQSSSGTDRSLLLWTAGSRSDDMQIRSIPLDAFLPLSRAALRALADG